MFFLLHNCIVYGSVFQVKPWGKKAVRLYNTTNFRYVHIVLLVVIQRSYFVYNPINTGNTGTCWLSVRKWPNASIHMYMYYNNIIL